MGSDVASWTQRTIVVFCSLLQFAEGSIVEEEQFSRSLIEQWVLQDAPVTAAFRSQTKQEIFSNDPQLSITEVSLEQSQAYKAITTGSKKYSELALQDLIKIEGALERSWSLINFADLYSGESEFRLALSSLRLAIEGRYDIDDSLLRDRIVSSAIIVAAEKAIKNSASPVSLIGFSLALLPDLNHRHTTILAWAAVARALKKLDGDALEPLAVPPMVSGLLYSLAKSSDRQGIAEYYSNAVAEDQFLVALVALSFASPEGDIHAWGQALLAQGEIRRAQKVAIYLDDASNSSELWLSLAKIWFQSGRDLRGRDAVERAKLKLSLLGSDALKKDGYKKLVRMLNVVRQPLIAKEVWQNNLDVNSASVSLAETVSALIRHGYVKEAQRMLSGLNAAERDRIMPAFDDYMLAYQEEDIAIAIGTMADNSLNRYFEPFLSSRSVNELIQYSVTGEKLAAAAFDYLVANYCSGADEYQQVQQLLVKRSELADRLVSLYADKKISAEAVAVCLPYSAKRDAEVFRNASASLIALRELVTYARTDAEFDDILSTLQSPATSDKTKLTAAHQFYVKDLIPYAARLLITVNATDTRILAMRRLAEAASRDRDIYGILDPTYKAKIGQLQNVSQVTKENGFDIEVRQSAESRLGMSPHIETLNPSTLAEVIPLPANLPMIHTRVDDLRRTLPVATSADVARSRLSVSADHKGLAEKFTATVGRSVFADLQGQTMPDLIHVSQGVADFYDLYDSLKFLGYDDYIVREAESFIVRRPIVIGDNATLIIDGLDVPQLKLSAEKGAYVSSGGRLYLIDTEVAGWSESKNQTATANYSETGLFRPFITAWSDSELFIGGSEFYSLGYANTKSYGISLTTGPGYPKHTGLDKRARPTAVIVDSSFVNMYFGFYSYEADDVALIGNEYKQNIVYGPDPHDRSKRLIIAYNTAYHTEKKHGMIISREVEGSSFIGNVSFDNEGTGIMVERQSRETITYANTVFGNLQDGVALFESNCQVVAANLVAENHGGGVVVRNGIDNLITGNYFHENMQSEIHVYTSELNKIEKHSHRDFVMDPYWPVSAASLIKNNIEVIGQSGIKVDDASAMSLKGNRIFDSGANTYVGEITDYISYAQANHDLFNRGIVAMDACIPLKPSEHSCQFRQQGFFDGDGQAELHNLPTNFELCPPSPTTAVAQGAL